jgi:hypothetical protein
MMVSFNEMHVFFSASKNPNILSSKTTNLRTYRKTVHCIPHPDDAKGYQIAEVDAARSADRAATTPARVATGTKRPPIHADRSDANQTDMPRNNNIYYGSIVFLLSFFLSSVSHFCSQFICVKYSCIYKKI